VEVPAEVEGDTDVGPTPLDLGPQVRRNRSGCQRNRLATAQGPGLRWQNPGRGPDNGCLTALRPGVGPASTLLTGCRNGIGLMQRVQSEISTQDLYGKAIDLTDGLEGIEDLRFLTMSGKPTAVSLGEQREGLRLGDRVVATTVVHPGGPFHESVNLAR
jgi:hypothetical protein